MPSRTYIETSVIGYLSSRPTRDALTNAHQQVTPKQLAGAILQSAALPAKATADATHIAIATVNAMDFLLTWNCTHIANAIVLRRVTTLCRDMGYEPPIVCTPEELMEG